MRNEKVKLPVPLPKGITKKDCEYKGIKYDDRDYNMDFELWYTDRFGWVIPTLTIRNASRRGHSGAGDRRTYAVTVGTDNKLSYDRDKRRGQLVRVGLGPHVKVTLRVFGRKSRKAVLQPYLDLRTEGEAQAGDTRDRISTRRAQTAARRSALW